MHWRKYFILRALLIFITSIFVVPDFKFYLVSIVPFVFDELLLMGLFRGKAKEAVISFLPPYSPSLTYFTSIILTSLSMKSEPELNKKMKMIKMKIKKNPYIPGIHLCCLFFPDIFAGLFFFSLQRSLCIPPQSCSNLTQNTDIL